MDLKNIIPDLAMRMVISLFFVCFSTADGFPVVNSFTNDSVHSTFTNYAFHEKQSTHVFLRFYLQRIYKLDSAEQTISIAGTLKVKWRLDNSTEENGTISPALWSGTTYPLIISLNAVETTIEKTPIRFLEDTTSLQNELGEVFVMAEARLQMTVFCEEVSIVNFPKDEHNCQISFALASRGDIQAFSSNQSSLNDFYRPCPGWKVLELTEKLSIESWPESEQRYIYSAQLQVRRNNSYYLVSLVTPVLYLVILLFMVFSLPVSETGEKIQLSITILLAFTVFLMLTDQSMPKMKIPGLNNFLNGLMLICSLYVCGTVLTGCLQRHELQANPLPLKLARLIGRVTSRKITWALLAKTFDRILMIFGIFAVSVLVVFYVVPLL